LPSDYKVKKVKSEKVKKVWLLRSMISSIWATTQTYNSNLRNFLILIAATRNILPFSLFRFFTFYPFSLSNA